MGKNFVITDSLDHSLITDKNQIKQVFVMFPLHRQGLTSYLSPILGQYGIRNSDFITTAVADFHKLTNNTLLDDFNTEDVETQGLINYELSIPILLKVYKAGKYSINAFLPHVGSLYRAALKKRRVKRKKMKLYRSWKKFYQLSIYSTKKEISSTTFLENSNFLNQKYLSVRNSLHRKR